MSLTFPKSIIFISDGFMLIGYDNLHFTPTILPAHYLEKKKKTEVLCDLETAMQLHIIRCNCRNSTDCINMVLTVIRGVREAAAGHVISGTLMRQCALI